MSIASKFALAALLVSFTLPALAQDKPLTTTAKPTAPLVIPVASSQNSAKPVPATKVEPVKVEASKAPAAKTEILKTSAKQPASGAAPLTKIN